MKTKKRKLFICSNCTNLISEIKKYKYPEQKLGAEKLKGYKAFNKDWTCRGFQYEVGKTYAMDEKPRCCNTGFHFCTNIADCFKHYNKDPENTKIWNTGSYNACNYSTGIFNTIEAPMYLFNKPTDFTKEEFRNIFPNEYVLLFESNFSLTEWVFENAMTDKEKEENLSYKTTGGYLKARTYKEAWALMWNSWSKKEQKSIQKLPNFDKEVFKEITGIEV